MSSKRSARKLFKLSNLSERFWRNGAESLPPILPTKVLTVRSLEHLQKAMGWPHAPLLEEQYLREFEFLTDLNDRRLRDAEVIATACRNEDPSIVLEIGTSTGKTTALMAKNAPDATVHTVNIPPEEIDEGGKLTTHALDSDKIGRYYKDAGLTNIRQILANTANWEPDFEPIDVAFIDGCHDADFVYNDTVKVLEKSISGSIILWHDFAPELAPVYHWIDSVCSGIERLYQERRLRERILHLQDSWVGLYRVP